ncbi:MAG: glycosyltransferase family protein [Rhodospirillales bacterium]|nr:glycosyltransferase family protein [Rhodospirillales bacterium]
MTTTAVIIQARMASSRLPGKVLLDLGGRTVLSHVIERCLAINNADIVCCAIADGADCDSLAEEAESCGAHVFRGSQDDVLDRYHRAAVSLGADVVLRVTSDCPVIDPDLCEQVIELLKDSDCDFATNNAPPSWPHGLDCEAFSAALLAEAATKARAPYEREHVSPWMRNNNDAVKVGNVAATQAGLSRHRWTLDTPADYTFFRQLFERMPGGAEAFGYRVPLAIVEADPSLAAINSAVDI